MEFSTGERDKLSPSSDSSDSSRNGTIEKGMSKSKVHTTRAGTQYVNVVDVIQSEAGWAEIKEILDAELVEKPSSPNGGNTPSPAKHNDAA